MNEETINKAKNNPEIKRTYKLLYNRLCEGCKTKFKQGKQLEEYCPLCRERSKRFLTKIQEMMK